MSRFSSGLLAGLLLWSFAAVALAVAAEGGKSVVSAPQVVLTLKITDKQSGFVLEAKRSVPRGSNALQVMREMVAVKDRVYPDVGPFVTGLCGVDAPEGMVWTFTVDDKWSDVGIGKLTLEKDVVVEWTTR